MKKYVIHSPFCKYCNEGSTSPMYYIHKKLLTLLSIMSILIKSCHGALSKVGIGQRLLFVPSSGITKRNNTGFSIFQLPIHMPLQALCIHPSGYLRRNYNSHVFCRQFNLKRLISTRFFSSTNKNEDEKHDDLDEEYTYNDGRKVPSNLYIPIHELDFSFARSSGAGGQNVNKVETQVILKLHLDSAHWIPAEVRGRIQQNERNRINKEGYLVLSSQEHRTQNMNRNQVVDKLREIILKHYARPKERTTRMVGSFSTKEKIRKMQEKKRQSITKENRRKDDY